MDAALGSTLGGPPVWCWHSCGERGRGPTVETARSLLTDWDFNQGLVTIELTVPPEIVLLSSYSRWNDFLGHVLERKSLPTEDRQWLDMFDDQFKHEGDDLQAAIPYLRAEWIVSIRELTIKGREPDELV